MILLLLLWCLCTVSLTHTLQCSSELPSSCQCLNHEQVLMSAAFQTDSWKTTCKPSLALTLGAAQQGQLRSVDLHGYFPPETQTATRSVYKPQTQSQRWIENLCTVAVGQCCSCDHMNVPCWEWRQAHQPGRRSVTLEKRPSFKVKWNLEIYFSQ